MNRLKISDILKDENAKLNVGKLDFNNPWVKSILEENRKQQAKTAEQIRRNNSREGLDKEITI